jgi:hypothetical protein
MELFDPQNYFPTLAHPGGAYEYPHLQDHKIINSQKSKKKNPKKNFREALCFMAAAAGALLLLAACDITDGALPMRAAAGWLSNVRTPPAAPSDTSFPPLHPSPFRGLAVDISSDNGSSQHELAARMMQSDGWELLVINPFSAALPLPGPRIRAVHGFPLFDELAGAGLDKSGSLNRTILRVIGGLCPDPGHECALVESPVTSEISATSLEVDVVDVGELLRNMDSRAPCTMSEVMGVETAADPTSAAMSLIRTNAPCGKCIMKCAHAGDKTSCAMACARAHPSGVCYLRLSVGYFDVAKVLLAWPWNEDWLQFWPDHIFLPQVVDSMEDADVCTHPHARLSSTRVPCSRVCRSGYPT